MTEGRLHIVSTHAMSRSLHLFSHPVCHSLTVVLLLLLLAVLCSPAIGQSTSPLSVPSSGFVWFQPNASALNLSSNASFSTSTWTDAQQQVTLISLPNSTQPLFDPVGLSLSFNSSALTAPASLFGAVPLSANVTILATINIASPCIFPACVLLSTAARNVTGSLLLSAVPVPPVSTAPYQQANQYYLQLTLVTSTTNAITVQSSIPLSFFQWQYIAIVFPASLLSSATVELRTVVGDELLTLALPAGSTDSMPASVTLSAFTLGDTGGLHALFRDVAVGFQPLAVGELDAALAYFYSIYALTYPPMRMPVPSVQLINATATQAVLQLSWTAPFSPTSSIVSYQVRVTSNASVPLMPAQSLLFTFSNLTSLQYTVRRDGSSAYSFAVTACNADYPYPPIVAPLLYSAPYVAPSGNLTVNSTIAVLTPPSTPNAPQVYLASAPNITVYVGYPAGANLSCALTTSPCYPNSPLTSIALFYTNDQSGSSQNFTWVTQPVWSFTPSTWSWYALTTGLVGNQFYAFKVQVSNAAGGVNTTVSSGFLLPGTSGNVISSTAGSSSTPSTGVVVNVSSTAAATGQSPRSSSSSSSSTAANGTRVGVSSSASSTTAASSTTISSSSVAPPTTANLSVTGSSSSASSTGNFNEHSSTSLFSMSSSLHSSSSSVIFNTSASDGSSFGASSNDSLIAGVIIGAFGGIMALVVLTYCCFCRKRQTGKKPSPPHSAATSTYASPRPSASLPPATSFDRGMVAPGGALSNRRVHAKRDKTCGGRGGTTLSAEGDMEMAELEAEWDGDDAGHQMKPQPQQPTHQAVHAFRR